MLTIFKMFIQKISAFKKNQSNTELTKTLQIYSHSHAKMCKVYFCDFHIIIEHSSCCWYSLSVKLKQKLLYLSKIVFC